MSTAFTSETVWVIVTVVAVVSLAFRLSFFLLFERREEIPPWAERVLRYVAPAVLAALVVPKVLYVGGSVSLVNPRLAAGLVAAVVAWRTENLAITVAVGMVVFWGSRAVL
ncbi:MAG: AzlD domain-containing protein [Salinigranum sp.]